jgi:hypothetical protein
MVVMIIGSMIQKEPQPVVSNQLPVISEQLPIVNEPLTDEFSLTEEE